MPLDMLGTLAVLALVDSLSVGTLLVPVFFLLAPGRLRLGRVLVYLTALGVFYLALGTVLLLTASTLLQDFSPVLSSTPARLAQLVLGVGLLTAAVVPRRGKVRTGGGGSARSAAGDAAPDGSVRHRPAHEDLGTEAVPGRLVRWRDRALEEDGILPLVLLALGAGLVEAATMLPYLAAIGTLGASDLSMPLRFSVLVGYCLVMVLPAVLLTLARVTARSLVEPALQRFAVWMQRNAAENTAWILGIVGFLLARDAITALGLFGFSPSSGALPR